MGIPGLIIKGLIRVAQGSKQDNAPLRDGPTTEISLTNFRRVPKNPSQIIVTAEKLLAEGKYLQGVEFLTPHIHQNAGNAELILLYAGLLANLSESDASVRNDTKDFLDRAKLLCAPSAEVYDQIGSYYHIAGFSEDTEKMLTTADKYR